MCGKGSLPGSYLNASLQEARRGLIVIGDLQTLSGEQAWAGVLRWANEEKLLLFWDDMKW